MKIQDILIKVIKDSRDKDTLEAHFITDKGEFISSIPAGKSTGAHEVKVIEPHLALEKFSQIKEKIISQNFLDQKTFDDFLLNLDGTSDKSNLGGNLILSLSMAFARAMAREMGLSLYDYLRGSLNNIIPNVDRKVEGSRFSHPIFNVINGGAHAKNTLDFQEFQVIPMVNDYAVALSMGQEFYRKLGASLTKKFGKDNVVLGDEAGYSCSFKDNEEVLDILYELIRENKYPMRIGLDVAATQYYGKDGKYSITRKAYTSDEITKYYEGIISRYDIVSIEDPYYEEDFDAFSVLTKKIDGIQNEFDPLESKLVITDDLTTTNPIRLSKAVEKKSGNTILIKPNQIGSVWETLGVIAYAYEHKWMIIVSHRSGETMDSFIADLAYACDAWGIKTGAPGKPERMAKYNRLLEIYQEKENNQ